MAAYRQVYDLCHLQADCQEPESAPEPYAGYNRVWAIFYHPIAIDETGGIMFLGWSFVYVCTNVNMSVCLPGHSLTGLLLTLVWFTVVHLVYHSLQFAVFLFHC